MMQRWLEVRGQEVPGPHAMHMHGATLMPGMLTAEEMDRLADAKGAEFDRLFLEGMIKHHGGALTMVQRAVRHAGRRAGVGDLRVRVRRGRRSAHGDRSHGRHAQRNCQGASAMRSAAVSVSVLLRAAVARRGRSRAAQQDPGGAGDQRSARRPQGRAARCRRGRAEHGADREPAEAGGLLRSEGAGRQRRRRRSRDPERAAPRTAAPDGAPARPTPPSRVEPAGLHQLRPGVQRQPRLRRQLSRVQHLRRRASEQAEAAGLGRVSRRPGRRVGPRQSAVHVGGADARPARLRHAGRADAGQRRAVPRRPHLRHHAT